MYGSVSDSFKDKYGKKEDGMLIDAVI